MEEERIKHYPKIRHKLRGEVNWEDFGIGKQIIIQEKVDGSQLRVSLDKIRSPPLTELPEGQDYVINTPKVCSRTQEPDTIDKSFGLAEMYFLKWGQDTPQEKAYKLFKEIDMYIHSWNDEFEFERMIVFGEFLGKPRQASLYYENIPKNHVSMFDLMLIDKDDNYTMINPIDPIFIWIAEFMDIDMVPVLESGESKYGTQDLVTKCEEYINEISYLGREKREGVVVKNYEAFQGFNSYGYTSHYSPSKSLKAVKIVRPEFSEGLTGKKVDIDRIDMNSIVGITRYIAERYLQPKGRILKAMNKVRETSGGVEPDINYTGDIIKVSINDVLEEEFEEINKLLWKAFKHHLGKQSKIVREAFFEILEEQLIN